MYHTLRLACFLLWWLNPSGLWGPMACAIPHGFLVVQSCFSWPPTIPMSAKQDVRRDKTRDYSRSAVSASPFSHCKTYSCWEKKSFNVFWTHLSLVLIPSFLLLRSSYLTLWQVPHLFLAFTSFPTFWCSISSPTPQDFGRSALQHATGIDAKHWGIEARQLGVG